MTGRVPTGLLAAVGNPVPATVVPPPSWLPPFRLADLVTHEAHEGSKTGSQPRCVTTRTVGWCSQSRAGTRSPPEGACAVSGGGVWDSEGVAELSAWWLIPDRVIMPPVL
ncbi:hypothetical protein GCM10010252_77460 [Streptomyces aureoverticillatus]|nr:hypothetical protein GCM10010252_77460 [Streptomyces aureoverticillatus]